MNKICRFIVILAFALSFFTIFTYSEEYNGTYVAAEALSDGNSINIKDKFPEGFEITLKTLDRCIFSINGVDYEGMWSLNEDCFTAEFSDGTVLSGTLNDNSITLIDVFGLDISFTLSVANNSESDSASDLSSADDVYSNLPEYIKWWYRDWYGFWVIGNSDGAYSQLDGSWWDCCAAIELLEDGTGCITVWDEASTYDEPLAFANVTLSEQGRGDFGTLYTEIGGMYSMDFTHADWVIDPEESAYDNMIVISGNYKDDNGSFEYSIILRPWGYIWDDITEEDTEDYETYYYDDWYLPLIEAGITLAPNGFVGTSE